VLHEAAEVYNYHGCAEQESNPRLKALWERFLDYELGQLHVAIEHFQRLDGRDVAEILPTELPDPIPIESQREFVRKVLAGEVDLRADGTQFVDKSQEPQRSIDYREQLNSAGSPTEQVADGYRWRPGTELRRAA
jgi:hypothetical protein